MFGMKLYKIEYRLPSERMDEMNIVAGSLEQALSYYEKEHKEYKEWTKNSWVLIKAEETAITIHHSFQEEK